MLNKEEMPIEEVYKYMDSIKNLIRERGFRIVDEWTFIGPERTTEYVHFKTGRKQYVFSRSYHRINKLVTYVASHVYGHKKSDVLDICTEHLERAIEYIKSIEKGSKKKKWKKQN